MSSPTVFILTDYPKMAPLVQHFLFIGIFVSKMSEKTQRRVSPPAKKLARSEETTEEIVN